MGILPIQFWHCPDEIKKLKIVILTAIEYQEYTKIEIAEERI